MLPKRFERGSAARLRRRRRQDAGAPLSAEHFGCDRDCSRYGGLPDARRRRRGDARANGAASVAGAKCCLDMIPSASSGATGLRRSRAGAAGCHAGRALALRFRFRGRAAAARAVAPYAARSGVGARLG